MNKFFTIASSLTVCFLTLFLPNAQAQICNDAATGNRDSATAFNLGAVQTNNTVWSPQLCLDNQGDVYKFLYAGQTYYMTCVRNYGSVVTPNPYRIRLTENNGRLTVAQHLTFVSLDTLQHSNYFYIRCPATGLTLNSPSTQSDTMNVLRFDSRPPTISATPLQFNIPHTSGTYSFNVNALNNNVYAYPLNNNISLPFRWLEVMAPSNWNADTTSFTYTFRVNSNGLATDTVRRDKIIIKSTNLQLDSIVIQVTQMNDTTRACSEIYEPNDSMSVATILGELSPTAPVTRRPLCLTPNDKDYFRFSVQGVPYFAVVKGFSQFTSGAYGLRINIDANRRTIIETFSTNPNEIVQTDTYLELRDALGNLITSNDDAVGSSYSQIIYQFNTATLFVSVDSIRLSSASAAARSFTVVSNNTAWNATYTGGWFSISPSTGQNGTSTVNVSFQPNTITQPRSSQIIITPVGGGAPLVVTVWQPARDASVCVDAFEPNDSIPQATVMNTLQRGNSQQLTNLCLVYQDKDVFKVNVSGSTYYIEVSSQPSTTNILYQLNISIDSNGFGTIRTLPSTSDTSLSVYLQLKDSFGNLIIPSRSIVNNNHETHTYYFPLLQATYLRVDTTRIRISGDAYAGRITVNSSNTVWRVQSNSSWLSGGDFGTLRTGNAVLPIIATVNTTGAPRNGVIAILGQGVPSYFIYVEQAAQMPPPCNEVGEPNNTIAQARNVDTLTPQQVFKDTSMCLIPLDEDFIRFRAFNRSFVLQVKGHSTVCYGGYQLNIIPMSDSSISIWTGINTLSNDNTGTQIRLFDSTGQNILAIGNQIVGSNFSNIQYRPYAVPLLTVNTQTYQLPFIGGSVAFSVVSNNVAWTISNMPSWVTLSRTEGFSGIYEVVARATTYTDVTPRIAILTISGGGFSRNIQITQAGIAPLANCVDNAEPNNSEATATNIGTVFNSFEANDRYCLGFNDEDYFKFQMDTARLIVLVRPYSPLTREFLGRYGLRITREGNYVTIRTTIPNNSNCDTYLKVMNMNGTVLAQNNNAVRDSFFSSVTVPLNASPPSNNEPCNATALAVSDSASIVYRLFDNVSATTTTTITQQGLCIEAVNDVWFTALMPSSGVMTIRTLSGSVRDAVMAVYRSNRCDSMTLVACEDDNVNGNRSFMPVITVTGTPGERIYIRLWGFGRQRGTFQIGIQNSASVNIAGNTPSAKVQKINVKANQTIWLTAFPNPASNRLDVKINLAEKQTEQPIQLFTANGQLVWQDLLSCEKGSQLISIDISDLPVGLYGLRLGSESIKVQIVR